jgi:hypothetical protein
MQDDDWTDARAELKPCRHSRPTDIRWRATSVEWEWIRSRAARPKPHEFA